jgi:hypothetical protein
MVLLYLRIACVMNTHCMVACTTTWSYPPGLVVMGGIVVRSKSVRRGCRVQMGREAEGRTEWLYSTLSRMVPAGR